MSAVDQAEVEQANRDGRLHPSQRGKILDFNFWAAAVLVVAGIGVLVIAPRDLGIGSYLVFMSPVLALVAWFAFVSVRRLGEVRDGRLVAITGWTHDYGEERAAGQFPIELRETHNRGVVWHYLHAGGRTYRVDDRSLWARIQPERNNTVLVTPRSKLLINVIPA